MLTKSFGVRKALTCGVVFLGTLAMLKLMQDAKYVQKDLHKFTEVQMSERDLGKIQSRFKLSDMEMASIMAAKNEKNKDKTINLIEEDPNFQHKRVE